MPDDDVDVVLRLRAIDDTGRVMSDAVRNAKSFTEQMSRGLTENTAAAKKLTEVMTEVSRSTTKHTEAVKGESAAMAAATKTVLSYAAGFTSLTAALETVRRGYTAFAESSRTMERIQASSRATTEEIEALSQGFLGLAKITGETTNSLAHAFSAFKGQSGLGLQDAKNAFETVALAAHAAGVETSTMSHAAVTALTNMKVPAQELGGVLDTWVNTIPGSMLETWSQASPRITSMLRTMGFTGKEAAEQIAGAFADMSSKMGQRQAVSALESILSKAKDINTTIGLMSTNLIDKLQNDPDKVNKLLGNLYDNAKKMGLYDTSKSSAQRSLVQNMLQYDDHDVQGLQHIGEHLEKINKIAKDTGLNVSEVQRRLTLMATGPKSQLDSMLANLTQMSELIGKLFSMTGIPNALKAILEDTVGEMERIVKVIEWIEKHVPGMGKAAGVSEPGAPEGSPTRPVAEGMFGKAGEYLGAPGRAKFEGLMRMLGMGDLPGVAPPQGPFLPPSERARIDAADQATQKKVEDAARSYGAQGTAQQQLESLARGLQGHKATGGEFIVPGSGRGDDQPVSFMGTPGERVTIASIPEQDRAESLQKQQDKADIALQEHFARFRGKSRPGAQLGTGWPGDILGRGGAGGGGGGGDPATAGTGVGAGGRGGQASGTGPAGTGDGGTDPGGGIKTPVGTDPQSGTGPAESLEEAYKRGYLKPPAASGGGGGDAAFLANYRKKYTDEMNSNPAVKNAVANILSHESDNVTAKTAVLEAWIVRAIQNNDKSILDDVKRGFFGPVNRSEVNPNAPASKFAADQAAAAVANVAGGSNLTDFRNDSGTNRQGNPEIPRGTSLETAGVIKPGGEHVYYANTAGRAYADRKRAEMIAARTGVVATPGDAGAPQGSTTGDLRKSLEGGDTGTLSEQDKWIAQRYNGHDWTWKDDQAAAKAGLTRDQYVVGGMDPRVRQAMYEQGTKYEKETGKKFEFTSGFRGDYRQSLITGGVHAPTGYSTHGGSQIDLGGTAKGGDKNYGYGGAFDSTPEFGAWLKRQGSGTGIAWTGEHIGGDPYHVSGAWTREAAKFGLKMSPQQLAALEQRAKEARANEEKTRVAGPAAVSDVETRAAERYKAALEHQASTAAPTTPPAPAQASPAVTAASAARRSAAARSIAAATRKPRAVSAPGHEDTAAGKGRPAPVVRPVSPEGHEEKAAGKGLAEGGTAHAGEEYLVGEQGPEVLQMGSQTGSVRAPGTEFPGDDRINPTGPSDSQFWSAIKLLNPMANAAEMVGKGFAPKMFRERGKSARDLIKDEAEDPLEKLKKQREGEKSFLLGDFNHPKPVTEPIIRPRIQNYGPLSMRWTRQSERQRHQDISRDQARAAHVDQGFA